MIQAERQAENKRGSREDKSVKAEEMWGSSGVYKEFLSKLNASGGGHIFISFLPSVV